jgi:hypothetical protein
MKKVWMLALALAVPTVTFSMTSEANAGPRRLIKRLVKVGALSKEDVAGLKGLKKEMRECRKAVRAGQQPRGSCRPKAIAGLNSVKALLERALAKVDRAGLKRKVERALRKITRRIKRMEQRAAQPPAAPAPVAPPAK